MQLFLNDLSSKQKLKIYMIGKISPFRLLHFVDIAVHSIPPHWNSRHTTLNFIITFLPVTSQIKQEITLILRIKDARFLIMYFVDIPACNISYHRKQKHTLNILINSIRVIQPSKENNIPITKRKINQFLFCQRHNFPPIRTKEAQ